MATDLGRTKTARASTSAKQDAFVLAQLKRAERRIRRLDVSAALLGFAALICVFLALGALADYVCALPEWARQLSLLAFLLGSGAYLYATLLRPLRYKVNPYYSAQAVEQSMPGAKNSVVNWLDLQHLDLPPAIHAAVGQKAAKDLSKADLDRAFSARRVLTAGGVAGLCAAGLLACCFFLGGASFSRLQRIATPFSFSGAEPRTTIILTRPVEGDLTVTVGHAVFFGARIEGKQPDPKNPETVRVLYRYLDDEPFRTRVMRPDGGEFATVISAADLRDGFYYKVAAGATETPEYRVTVRATPLLTEVQATYHFRAYVGRAEETHGAKRPFKLEALRGTEIALAVRTNRPVKEAYLVVDDADKKPERFAATTVAGDNQTFMAKLTVERTTRYHLEYTTPDGESYLEPNFQEIVAVPDLPPEPVELKLPGRAIQLPCNGVLSVEGAAADDVGVRALTLQLKEVTQNFALRGKAYRTDKELQLPSGGYAQRLDYKDFVDLNTVQTPDGKLLALQPGMELEYWLESSDACDYPQPHTSGSQHYRVQLLPPLKDQDKVKQQTEQAKQEQQQHEGKQNEALKNEERKRHDEQRRREDEAKEDQAASTKPGQPDEKKNDGAPNKNEPSPQEKETRSQAEKLQDEVNKEKQRQEQRKQEKQPSEPKKGPQEAPSQPKSNPGGERKPKPGEAKPDGKPEQHQDKAVNKADGAKTEPKPDAAEAKPEGKPDPMSKPGESKPEAAPSAAPKSEPKADPQAKPEPRAEAKKEAPPQQQEAAANKPEGQPNEQECKKAECKNGGKTTKPDSKTATPKPTPSPEPNASEGKNAGPNDQSKDPKAEQKPGGTPSSADNKPAPKKPDEDVARGEAKKESPSGNKPSSPRDATPEDVAKAIDQLKSDDPEKHKDGVEQLVQIAQQCENGSCRTQAEQALKAAGEQPPPAKKPEEVQREKKAALKQLEDELKKKGEFDEKHWRDFLDRYGDGDPTGKTVAKGRNGTGKRPEASSEEDGPPEIKNGERRAQPASLLQLRDFLQTVDKKMLKDSGMSAEQWREFLKNYAALALRDEAAQEQAFGPQNRGPLSGIGGVRQPGGTNGNPNDPRGAGAAKAPPGYRDGWRKFINDLNSDK